MQAEAWQVHIFNAGCGIQGSQTHSKFLLVIRLNACHAIGIEKLQAFTGSGFTENLNR